MLQAIQKKKKLEMSYVFKKNECEFIYAAEIQINQHA